MAVAQDASSESHTGTTGSTSAASFNWWHSVGASVQPRGVLVFTMVNANADDATAVTFNGVAMTAVTGGRAVDTAGEPGDCKAWFLGSGVPDKPTYDPTGAWETCSGIGNNTVNRVRYLGGYWLIAGLGTISYNADALPDGREAVWLNTTDEFSSPDVGYDIAYADGRWVCVGGVGGTGRDGICVTTTDPTTNWAAASSFGFTTKGAYCVATDGTTWVAGGEAGTMRYATDPTGTWTAVSSHGFGVNAINRIFYDSGTATWVAVGDAGNIRYSTTPTTTWTAASSPGFGASNVRCVAKGGATWVAGGDTGTLRTASDPTGTWTAASAPGFGTNNVFDVGYDASASRWVACGGVASVRFTATPTGTWTAIADAKLPTNEDVNSVATNGSDKWMYCTSGNARFHFSGGWKIVVTRNNNANEMWACAVDLTALTDTAVRGIVLLQEDGTFAAQAITDTGSPGTNSFRYAAANSGLSGVGAAAANTLTVAAGSGEHQGIDFGTRVASFVRESTAGTGARNVGWTSTTSDDRAAVHLAITEVVPVVPGFNLAPRIR